MSKITGYCIGSTEKATQFELHYHGSTKVDPPKMIWVPKSQLEDQFAEGDMEVITLPEWLFNKILK